VKRTLPAAAFLAAVAILVGTGMHGSPGSAMRIAIEGYASGLASCDAVSAASFLSESLAALVGPAALESSRAPEWSGRLLIGREEARGFAVLLGGNGASRMIWLRRSGDSWAVSGDTWLDGVLGSAAMTCRDYAMDILPQVSGGAPAEDFSCPVSGLPYYVDPGTGRLLCPSGHLGEGLRVGSSACDGRRAGVAAEVERYVEAGYSFPGSLEEMWQESGGAFGQRGGYRCPDDGYSYYTLSDSMIWCPFHRAGTPVTPAAPEP